MTAKRWRTTSSSGAHLQLHLCGRYSDLAPEVVDLQDNKLEILLVRAPKNLAEIHECIVALNTQKYNCAMLTFRSATHIRIFADPEMPWTLDGEREEGHSEVVVTPQHLAYRLMKRQ